MFGVSEGGIFKGDGQCRVLCNARGWVLELFWNLRSTDVPPTEYHWEGLGFSGGGG